MRGICTELFDLTEGVSSLEIISLKVSMRLEISSLTFRGNVTAIDTTLTYKIIDWLGEHGFITVKAYPQVFSYRGIVEGGAQVHGYTDGKDIYLAPDNASNISTILEEVIHLYTGAKDSSRDIQDIAFNIASHLLESQL